MPNLRLGTRGSRLALAQATAVKALLESANPGTEVEIVTIKTSGDQGNRFRLGAFVKEIQEALLEDQVDLALHCLKDLPTQAVPGLTLSAYLKRENPNDALITRGETLQTLPPSSTIGTGSVRRTSQLASTRPDLNFKPLVGNIDTRLRKLIAGEYDAIVLAIAGLHRLGVLDSWSTSEYAALTVHELDPETMLPAPGQAVLVLESRLTDQVAATAVAPLHHSSTKRCADAEREFLAAFGGGCSVPVAALATEQNGELTLTGLAASPDGQTILKSSGTSGKGLAATLGRQGAFNLFNARIPT